MKIKKIGHCCLVIEYKGIKMMTDPGSFSTKQIEERNVDLILITHEHADHLHVESLKEVIKNNFEVKVITNTSVGNILNKEGISFEVLENFENKNFKEILIEAVEAKHEEIYGEFGQVQNTGYFIDNKLFYPGDAFADPKKQVEILALPVSAPWCRVKQVVDYLLSIKPKHAFPVHDGFVDFSKLKAFHVIPEKFAKENNINFIALKEGENTNIE